MEANKVIPMKARAQPHPLPRIEVITPETAKDYLNTMVSNRPVSDSKVLEYALSMDVGDWSLNGESLKFNDKGQLFDGQHRLRACILAEKPFKTYLVTGIDDPRAFATVDTGKGRTHADIFGIAGWQSNKVASAAALYLFAYSEKLAGWAGPMGRAARKNSPLASKVAVMKHSTSFTREEILEYGESIQEELQTAVRFGNSSKARSIINASNVASLYYLFRDKSRSAADQFFLDLGEGAGLTKGDPVLVLREKIAALHRQEGKMSRWMLNGLVIKAWNKRRDNERITLLKVIDGEAYPRVK